MKIFLNFIFKRKAVTVILLLVLVGVGYWYFNNKAKPEVPAKYVLAKIEKGTIISSISGSGQVSASDQLDIKSKVSGDVLKVAAVNGQEVKTGDVLVQISSKDAYSSVRDAQISLESARLSLEKLKKSATDLEITKAENTLKQAKDSLENLKNSQVSAYQNALDTKANSETALTNYYDSGFGEVSDSFLDFPAVLNDLKDMFFSNTVDASKQNIDWYANQSAFGTADVYANDFRRAYDSARSSYDSVFDFYKGESRQSGPAVIEDLINQSYDTAKIIADAINAADNFLRFTQSSLANNNLDVPADLTSHQSSLQSYINTIQGHVSSLSTANKNIYNTKKTLENNERSINDLKNSQPSAITAAEQSIKEKELSLADLKAGTDPLDLRAGQISVQQRQQALNDAWLKMADYTIKAPFDGIIASVDVAKGDSLSSGGAVLTLITKQQIAEISLNEVDAAKIKVGQKATLTFDALENLSIAGEVVDIDSIGTVSQGVVNYNVKIFFSTNDDQVKPGMSVSASVVTNFKQGVLLVSSSAIKTSGSFSYVETPKGVIDSAAILATGGIVLPEGIIEKNVEIGIFNDTQTEIISGLNEGDLIINRTILSSTSKTSTQSQGNSLLQSGGSRSGMMMPR